MSLARPFLARVSRCFAAVAMLGAMSYGLSAQADEAGKVVLVVGDVRMAGETVRVGDDVRLGAPLATGGDGYLYIKTVDNGFLILRPNSAATVVAYRVDSAKPAESRFKIELHQGVVRNISGEAVKSARQNFRFNTPVAAIGVRGTDFTAYADAQVTRVAVLSGGVVVSGFGDGCNRAGSGPCEGAQTRELFAGQPGMVLQVGKGQGVPQLIKGNGLSPDVSTPPRPDEPAGGSAAVRNGAATADANLDPLKSDRIALAGEAPKPAPEAVRPAIEWGRWQALADEKANIDLAGLMKTHNLDAFNAYFAMLRPKDAVWENPTAGSVDFRLQAAQALIQPDVGGTYAAAVENGRLHVNFAQSSFTTGFDLVANGQRIARQAEGRVFADGSFQNVSQYMPGNNMQVQGVLGRDTTLRAGYLFQSRLDDGRVAYGATMWAK